MAGPDEARAAVATAHAHRGEWASLSDAERCQALLAAADAIETNAEPLAQILTREQGKPLNGPNARFEVGACSAWLRVTCSHDVSPVTVVDDGETRATLSYKPIGVVAAIGPWNWPMMITIWQIAPALRMGNTVVVKPSEYTPLSVLALCRVVASCLPEGVLAVLTGGGEAGEVLTTDPRVGKVMFTGSTATGRRIAEASAATNKRLTLELGGNDAGIVLDDVDPAAIAQDLFWGAFINTGQTCAALKRLYVHDSVYEQVCAELAKVAAAMPMGEGTDEDNVLGPLQNQAQYSIVSELVAEAVASGARVLTGANPDEDAPGYFYPATLIADIDPASALVVREQFGPALPEQMRRVVDEKWNSTGCKIWIKITGHHNVFGYAPAPALVSVFRSEYFMEDGTTICVASAPTMRQWTSPTARWASGSWTSGSMTWRWSSAPGTTGWPTAGPPGLGHAASGPVH